MKPIVYYRVTPNFTIRLEMPPWMPYWFLFILAIVILCFFDYATR